MRNISDFREKEKLQRKSISLEEKKRNAKHMREIRQDPAYSRKEKVQQRNNYARKKEVPKNIISPVRTPQWYARKWTTTVVSHISLDPAGPKVVAAALKLKYSNFAGT
eukprot:gene11587-12781_t